VSRFDDYPYAQCREALGTLLGRSSLIILALFAGSILGGLTATRSLEGLWEGILGLPGFSLASIFFGPGLIVFPVVFLYAVLSIRYEWPLFLTLVCSILMWWNIHRTVRWTVYDSPMAKQQQKIGDEIDQAMKKAAKNREQ